MTAGLAAYLLRLGTLRPDRVKLPPGQQLDLSPLGLKKLLVGLSHARGNDPDLKAIWNGYDIVADTPAFGSCPYQPRNNLRRRQGSGTTTTSGGCTPPATSTTAQPTTTAEPTQAPPPPPPEPTGGFWLGAVLGDVPTVVGDKNHSCAWVNFDNPQHVVFRYQVGVKDSNGKDGNANTFLDGTKPFSIQKLALGNSVCFFDGLSLSFTPDSQDGTFMSKSWPLIYSPFPQIWIGVATFHYRD
jgi:hypothetical protein